VKTNKLVYSGLLIALGVLIPQAFHGFGENVGMMIARLMAERKN